MTCGDRLKELRNNRGITSEFLSKATGIPAASIRGLESKSNRVPRMDRLKILAEYYNVTTDYLLGAVHDTVDVWETRALAAELRVSQLEAKLKLIKNIVGG